MDGTDENRIREQLNMFKNSLQATDKTNNALIITGEALVIALSKLDSEFADDL